MKEFGIVRPSSADALRRMAETSGRIPQGKMEKGRPATSTSLWQDIRTGVVYLLGIKPPQAPNQEQVIEERVDKALAYGLALKRLKEIQRQQTQNGGKESIPAKPRANGKKLHDTNT